MWLFSFSSLQYPGLLGTRISFGGTGKIAGVGLDWLAPWPAASGGVNRKGNAKSKPGPKKQGAVG